MTLVGSSGDGGASTGLVAIFGLASPPSGSQTVQINASSSAFIQVSQSLTFTGTHATTADCFNGFQSDFAAAVVNAADTLTVTSQAGDLVLDAIGVFLSAAADYGMSPGTDQTERGEGISVSTEQNAATSTQAGAPSVAMDYSWTSTANQTSWVYCACNIVQAAAPTPIVIMMPDEP
jgi:hypothetical protein